MNQLFFLLALALFAFQAHSKEPSQPFFIPPKGWDVADPKAFSPSVQIAFLKNTGKGFCPSMNLAVEETEASLSEYLKAVKAIHEQDKGTHWRSLGKVRTTAGLGQLTEIDATTPFGPVRLLQLIFMKEGHAYVLTAAALREEFSNFYKAFQDSFRSFVLTSDLFASIPQLDQRENLKLAQAKLYSAAEERMLAQEKITNLMEDPAFREKHWTAYQKTVLSDFEEMGAHWQILVLRNAYEKLTALRN